MSSSSDGSCIIWDLNRYVRNQVLFAPTFFNACCYYPDESQLLTSGTDRKVNLYNFFHFYSRLHIGKHLMGPSFESFKLLNQTQSMVLILLQMEDFSLLEEAINLLKYIDTKKVILFMLAWDTQLI